MSIYYLIYILEYKLQHISHLDQSMATRRAARQLDCPGHISACAYVCLYSTVTASAFPSLPPSPPFCACFFFTAHRPGRSNNIHHRWFTVSKSIPLSWRAQSDRDETSRNELGSWRHKKRVCQFRMFEYLKTLICRSKIERASFKHFDNTSVLV